MSRYDDRRSFENKDEFYEEFFQERDVNFIKQFRTGRLVHPTVSQRATLERIRHGWKVGDRLYKLANKHYGNPKFWWVIAWYNLKPTEAHFKQGDVVRIPLPLDRVLAMLRVR